MNFSYARSALKYGLSSLKLRPDAEIIVPDFICDVLIHPMLQAGLVPFYYPVTQGLVPDWRALESMAAGSDCQALIMVHYFGQPQNIEKFQLFCSRHSLLLVEDNAHGLYGPLNGPSSMRASHTCAKVEPEPEIAERHAAQPRVRVEAEKTRLAEAPAGSKNSRRNR